MCSNPSNVGVPQNDQGWQQPHSGNGYAGLVLKAFFLADYREYLTEPLVHPLIGGKAYYASFYVSLANDVCGIKQIGAYFSIDPPQFEFGNFAPLVNDIPQVEHNGTFLSDTAQWMLIEGCFIAQGGENFITIGNFHSNANTPFDPLCTYSISTLTYYYLDDVYVSEIQPGGLDLDLVDGPVSACYDYTIHSGITGVSYLWNTGSTDPDLTVTTSGTYVLTIYDGCEAGVDSVEVLITNAPPVNLDPNITVCAGQSVSISLDPGLGNYIWNDGSTNPDYEITSTGTYTVTLDDGCDLTSDHIYVNVLEPPAPFSLGADTILCIGQEYEIYFDSDLGDFHWQNNSTSNSFIVTSAGEYELTITNMCGEQSAHFEVTEATPGIVNLGPDHALLCNGQSLDFNLDPALGTYVWQDGSTNPQYHIISSGLYSVTMTDICGKTADSVFVQALTMPVFNLGDTLYACPDDTLTLDVSGIIGNYTWQDGSTNDTLIITTPGSYALTIVNVCGMTIDTVVVDYQDVLFAPDLGPDVGLCPGDQVVLHAVKQTANYLWSDLSTADTLLVNAAGTYSVTVSNVCSSYSDTVIVTQENQPPVISLPDQITLCQGLIDTLDPEVTGVTYLWNDGSQLATLAVSDPGDYSLSVSNACGGDMHTVHVIDGGPMPTVSFGPDTMICPGTMLTLNPASANVNTWHWSDGSTSATYLVTNAGPVEVMVSNACGVALDTILIGLYDAIPGLDLGADTSLCPGEILTLSIPYPNVDIMWNDGTSDQTLMLHQAGIYFASISNVCGVSTDTFHLIYLDGSPALDLGPDLPLCLGEHVTLTPGIQGVDYLWQDGSIDTFYLVDQDQTVMLTISNACGTSSDTLTIYSSTLGPDVNLGPDIVACEGETVTLTSNITGVNYLWQDGTTGATNIASASGTYVLQVSNSCGIDIDTVQVDIHGGPPVAAIGNDTSLCTGSTLLLSASDDPTINTIWQDGSTLSSLLVTQPGTYSLTETNRCGMDIDTIVIGGWLQTPPFINLGPDTVLCPGETLTLKSPVTTADIHWQDGSTSPSIEVSQSGVYALTLSNDCGNTHDEVDVAFDDQSLVLPTADSFVICPGHTIVLDVLQPIAADYIWNTGSVMPMISVTIPGIYSVTVNTKCKEEEYVVHVEPSTSCSTDFYIPDIFSPNGDLVNDIFSISVGHEVEIISMNGVIYDRWGNQVFTSTAIPFTWDGRFKDMLTLPGVYVYNIVVSYKLNDQTYSERFTGDVTVIR